MFVGVLWGGLRAATSQDVGCAGSSGRFMAARARAWERCRTLLALCRYWDNQSQGACVRRFGRWGSESRNKASSVDRFLVRSGPSKGVSRTGKVGHLCKGSRTVGPHPAIQLPHATLSFRRSCSGTAAVISVRPAKPFSRQGEEGVAPKAKGHVW